MNVAFTLRAEWEPEEVETVVLLNFIAPPGPGVDRDYPAAQAAFQAAVENAMQAIPDADRTPHALAQKLIESGAFAELLFGGEIALTETEPTEAKFYPPAED